MDSETSVPSVFLKCCSCSCNCTLINGGSVTWQRSVKRKFDEFQDGLRNALFGYDQSSVARIDEIENECFALRRMVSNQQQIIQELYTELEVERSAASSAAMEAMKMILRLQREKAKIEMEARQFKRITELEKMANEQQEVLVLEELLYKRDLIIQALSCELQDYKQRILNFGVTEAEAEAEGEKSACGTPNRDDNVEFQHEFVSNDYPALRCNLNETDDNPDSEDDFDLNKYAFDETPRPFCDTPHTQERLQSLEHRIYEMGRNPSSNHFDGKFSGSRNIFDKGVIESELKKQEMKEMEEELQREIRILEELIEAKVEATQRKSKLLDDARYSFRVSESAMI
ncbi:hypothetical protein NE237_010666 [Protea cynaroides]|uniref:GTD-binding domain-containing protein n=1 Tax=Protea cynaroides TaxID=273540 RepID=A0A9Q0L066_9MAGN|nr:hypothetical protein NE237_010666 [Protea cynaroides]